MIRADDQKLQREFFRYRDNSSKEDFFSTYEITDSFVEKNQHMFNDKSWNYISRYQNLKEDFIEKHKERVNWNYISCYQSLSEEFISKFENKVCWYYISANQNLSESFIKKYLYKKLSLETVIRFQTLSEDFIEQHCVRDWRSVCKNQKISCNFIERHISKIDFKTISRYQKLNDDFISKHKTKLNWEYMLRYNFVSEKCIRLKKIRSSKLWDIISEYQPISFEFVIENINNISLYKLKMNKKINIKDFKERGFETFLTLMNLK
jgi:hypothetical protein